MFIRKTSKTVKEKVYIQHQLIESFRTVSGPRQRLICNLGQLEITKNQFKDLANRIEDILNNQPSLFESLPEIESLAQHYAQIIIQQRLNNEPKKIPKKKDIQSIDLNSIVNTQAKTIGGEHVVIEQMQQYNFSGILKKAGFEDKQIDYAQMLVAGRLLFPGSERRSVRWIEEMSGIKELLNTSVNVYDNALHRVALKLRENQGVIEEELSRSAQKVFDLKETILLYDLTNTYFEGTKAKSKITGFGHSKERRNDRPLVTLALVVDDQGFPKQSRILEGNVKEPQSLDKILDQLQDQKELWISQKKTIVIDAGIASEENLQKIRDKGMDYVAVSRKKSYDEALWKDKPWEVLELSDKKMMLKVKLIQLEKEAFLLCESEAKTVKEDGILNQRIERFEKALKELNDNLVKKSTQKKYAKILEKIGRIKQHYQLSTYYQISVEQKDGIVTSIDFKRNDLMKKKQRAVGRYVIRTSRMDLNAHEISKIHRSLTMVEDSFKCMKSDLGLRPNFHKEDEASLAHINITVMAYHIACGILKKLMSCGINHTWKTIREILSTHVRVTTTFNDKDENVIHMRNNTTPTAEQSQIYNALKVKHNPLGCVKSKDVVRKNRA